MPKSEIRQLPADKLIVDPTIQRNLDQRRVAKMAADFDAEAVGVLTVSRRANGSYHIVDGQHRHATARLALGDSAELACRVFTGLTSEDEARLFRLLNNTAKPQAIDLFRVRVIEGDPVATEIDRVIRHAGWDIKIDSAAHAFGAVAAADRLYKNDPSTVEKSITTITKAWGHDEADFRVFEGIGLLYARYGEAVELTALAERLAVFPGGQRALIGKARGLSDLLRVTVVKAVAEVVVEAYNARRKSKALPSWRS
jgi:hypothetical protein